MKKVILISTLFISYSLTAQIVHTDLVPDSVYSSNYTAHVDMDNNNNPDFEITGAYSSSGPTTLEFIIVQANSIGSLNYVLNTGTDVSVLAINTPINAAATTWFQLNTTNPSIATFVNSAPSGGLWAGKTGQFIGVQFLIGANTHYGWIKISVKATGNKMAVEEYAYNTTPNQMILAGQTTIISTSVNDVETNKIEIFPNPVNDILTINEVDGTVKLYDVTGKEVVVNTIYSNSIKMDLSQLDKGIYFLKVKTADNQLFTEKIIKD